jgi:hypothetical protein
LIYILGGKIMEKASKILMITLVLILSGSIGVWAGEVEDLIEFQSGEPALASDVNGNFTAVKTAVDNNAETMQSNYEEITLNASKIATNASEIEDNSEDLTYHTGIQEVEVKYTNITSTSNTEIAKLTLNTEGRYGVSLTAHAYIEINGPGFYTFTITRGSTSGNVVGKAYWNTNETGVHGTTICFTGYDSYVTTPTTYHLCAKKSSGSPNATVIYNGLNASFQQAIIRIIGPIGPIVGDPISKFP